MAEQQGNYPNYAQTFAGESWIIIDDNPTYLTGSNTTYRCPDQFPYIGYEVDPTFAQDDLYNQQNKQFGNYYYTVNSDGNGISFYNSQGTLVENVALDAQYLSRPVTLGGCGYSDIFIFRRQIYFKYNADMSVKEIGYAENFYATDNSGKSVSGIIYRPITNNDIKQALINNDDYHVDQRPGYTGDVIATLSGTDGFVLSNFPEEFYSKIAYSDEHNKYSEVVCEFDTDGEMSDRYVNNCAWVKRYSTYNVWTDKTNVQIATALAQKCPGIGSDMFRKLSNGQYYNGVDLEVNNCVWKISNPEVIIPFSNGTIKLAGINGFISEKRVYIIDKDNVTLDSCALPIPGDGGAATLPAGDPNFFYDMTCALYLSEYNGKYHLFGLRQFSPLYDDNGIQIKPGGGQIEVAFYLSHLYEFNNNASQLLKDGTVITTKDNPKQLPENSPGASFPGSGSDPMIGPNGEILPPNNPNNPYDPNNPDKPADDEDDPNNIHHFYDPDTPWPDNPPISPDNPNAGIRYNGNTIINGGDIENNTTITIPGAHQPIESGDGAIPTPINSGMLNILAPTQAEMALFGQDLNSTTFLQAITNYFSNPMDIVISAHTCIAPNLTTAGSAKHLVYGVWESAYTMTALSQMYYKVNMGSCNLPEQTNSFADYPPVSNYSIYLPFIGTREIPGSICVGRTLQLNYYINVLTGDIMAELVYKDNATGTEFPVQQYMGNTLARFPLKSTDYSSMINSAISGVFSTASAIGMMASGNVAGGLISGLSGIASAANGGLHPDINVNGTVAGSLCYAMYPSAYVIQRAPHFYNKLPYGYDRTQGKPSMSGGSISSVVTGNPEFISYQSIDLGGIPGATQDEKREIERLLKEGVYTK